MEENPESGTWPPDKCPLPFAVFRRPSSGAKVVLGLSFAVSDILRYNHAIDERSGIDEVATNRFQRATGVRSPGNPVGQKNVQRGIMAIVDRHWFFRILKGAIMGIRSVILIKAYVVLFVFTVPGCERRDTDVHGLPDRSSDYVEQFLMRGTQNAPDDSVWKKYRNMALEKWQNGVLDPEPILLGVQLSKSSKDHRPYLTVVTFDEDRDIAGVGVEEQLSDANGRKTEVIVEEYSIAAHLNQSDAIDVICTLRVPVQIRDAAQRKDPNAWEQYVAHPFDYSTGTERVKRWRQDLPPIWISAPKPHAVNIRIYAYDRAGHKSDAVEALNRLDETGNGRTGDNP